MDSESIKLFENSAAAWQNLRQSGLVSAVNGGSMAQKSILGKDRQVIGLFAADQSTTTVADLVSLTQTAKAVPPDGDQLAWQLQATRLSPDSQVPDVFALLHALLPQTVTLLVCSPALLALGARKDWKDQLQTLFGNKISPVEVGENLTDQLAELVADAQAPGVEGVFLRYIGLLTWADTAAEGVKNAQTFAHAIEALFPVTSESAQNKPESSLPALVEIAAERQAYSRSLNSPHLFRLFNESLNDGAASRAHQTLTPLASKIGAALTARSASELEQKAAQVLAEAQVKAMLKANGLAELLPFRTESGSVFSEERFDGEVAIITGAATGIGKATVQALLERGAAVAAFDIKPQICETFSTPAYMGLQVDLNDEAATRACIEKVVRTYGGVDMLVLNAGIFPPSCNIDALSMEHWRKVMSINVDVNITMLREVYPFLKLAPRYGRVVINSSRNVPAPGPGAVSYSASKAALTQVGRVAALEWANSGVRVNMVNPHAVFDTDLWTDEVIRSRAAKYNLTVEQYKTNNLLHVELFSRDVAELIASMLGPLFAKTTGAQVPVDGGSDRVV